MKPNDLSKDAAACFWGRVERTEGCWLWRGGLHRKGYGVFCSFGKAWKAHRMAYVLTHGEIPAGMSVLHMCDVRRCVNPAHLYLGTDKENTRDRIERGRDNTVTGRNRMATHCVNGHAFDAANTKMRRGGGRMCRECSRLNARAYYRAHSEQVCAKARQRRAAA